MVGRTKSATVAEKDRMDRIRLYVGCLPSLLRGFPNGHATVQHVVEGRKRLGHRYTYGASEWHHLGRCEDDMGVRAMTESYGPSLAHSPADYHDEFGSEHELVALCDRALELHDQRQWPEYDMPMDVANDLRRWYIGHRARPGAL